MYVTEASAANSKLKEFISNTSDENQKIIKDILNGIYLFIKRKGIDYEEISSPHKSPYHGTFTKMGGSKELDQLSWKLGIKIPLNYDKNAVYKFGIDLREEVKSLSKKIAGSSYFYDTTNKDFYDAIGFDSNKIVEVGKHTDGGGVFYDHNNNVVKVIYLIKVVVPRFVEDKGKIDTTDNHNFVMGKVKSFVEPHELKNVNKALETIYDYVNTNYNGCIESKKVMIKDAEIFIKDNSFNGQNKTLDYRALVWKTELKDTSKGYLYEDKLVQRYSVEDTKKLNVDGASYTIGRVSDDYYVGIREDFGSRDIRYLYFIILKPSPIVTRLVSTNKFLSSDGKNLKNTHVSVSYDRGRKSISGADLEDMFNMPRFYTTKTRGLEDAWERLVDEFNEKTTDSDCMRIIGYDKVRSYCAMD